MVAVSEPQGSAKQQSANTNQSRRLPKDPRNTGPATESRTHFEKEAIALAIIRACLHDDDLAGVAVQHSADVILIHRQKPPTVVSIKHRDPHQRSGDSGWSWTALKKQDVLQGLYNWWRETGRWCTIEFWSNSGFVGPCRDLHAACSTTATPTSAVIQATAKDLGTNPAEAAEFLHALTIPSEPLPRRKEIAVQGIDEMRRLLDVHRPNAALYAEHCYNVLVDLIVTLGKDGPANDKPGPTPCTAPSLDHLDPDDRRDLEAQYVDLENLRQLVLAEFDRRSGAALPDIGHRWEADPRFTGRRNELCLIAEGLQPGGTEPTTPIIIHGLAGSGKTSLATQFAAQHSATLRPIFISAGSRVTVIDALRRLAPAWDEQTWQSGLADAGTPVTPALPGTSATLLILDGVDDVDILRGLIPRQSLCRVLITSRVRGLDPEFTSIELGGWDREDSHTYLTAVLPSESEHNRDELADALHDHPLGLSQAATHCKLLSRSIKQFIELLHQAPVDALELGRSHGYPGSLVEAIRLNITEAFDRDPTAGDLLTLLAHLGPAPLAETLFERRWKVAWVTAFEAPPQSHYRWWRSASWLKRERQRVRAEGLSRSAPTPATIDIADRIWNRALRERAVDTLLRLCLITLRGNAFVVHPIVSIVARHCAKGLRSWLEIGIGLFAQDDDDLAEQEFIFDHNLEHVATLTATALENGFHGPPVLNLAGDLAARLSFLGSAGSTVVRGWTALDFGQRAVELAAHHPDAEQPSWQLFLADQRYKLAQVHVRTGLTDDAISLLQKNADVGARLGRFYTWINAVRDLASVAIGGGRPSLAKSTLQMIESIPSDRDINIEHRLAIAHTKTGLLRMLNRHEEAHQVNAWALRQIETAADVSSTIRSFIHEDAGLLARDRNDPTALLRHLSAVLDAQRARQQAGTRPDWHLINAIQSYGDGAIDAGNYGLAAELLAEAEELSRREFGANSDEHAIVLAVRGRLHLDTGRPQQALIDLAPAVKVLRSASDDSRKHLPAALVHLALAEVHLGHAAIARALAREAYELDLAIYGPNHPETLKDLQVADNIETLAMFFTTFKSKNHE